MILLVKSLLLEIELDEDIATDILFGMAPCCMFDVFTDCLMFAAQPAIKLTKMIKIKFFIEC